MQTIGDLIAIKKGIQKIRQAKRFAAILLLGLIPVGILSSILCETYKFNFLIIIGLYLAFVMLCGAYLGLTSKCPRCNELYYWRMTGIGYRNFFTKKCLNCGLELDVNKLSQ